MSLLTIIQGACGQLNIVSPSAVVAASDTQTLQLLQLAKVGGKDLARRLDWQVLTKEATFNTAATEIQVTDIPTTFPNFARILDGTMFDRTQSRPIRGPLNVQQWQSRKALAAQVGVEFYFRIRGNSILFNPVPPASDEVYFEYISNKWCQSSGAVLQATWLADNDTALIDEDLLQLDLVWRWLKAKGLDYSEEFRTFENAVIDLFGPDGGKAVVDMTGDSPNLWSANIPEGSWNL